jgi:uncharacterized protein DUF5675
MKLTITRKWFTDLSTQGMLDIDGIFECYSEEPSLKSGKLIPEGTYKLALLPSVRFETYTPHVLNVPDFTAIEIHPGNDQKDTEGCTMVGQLRNHDRIGNSRWAFNELMSKLDAVQDMEIEYVNAEEVAA